MNEHHVRTEEWIGNYRLAPSLPSCQSGDVRTLQWGKIRSTSAAAGRRISGVIIDIQRVTVSPLSSAGTSQGCCWQRRFTTGWPGW